MTRLELANQIERIINGGNFSSDNEIEISDVKARLDQEAAVIARIAYLQNKGAKHPHVDDQFYYTFTDVKTRRDDKLNRDYIDLPTSHPDIPDKTGIDEIAPQQSSEYAFIRVARNKVNLYRNLRARSLAGNIGYWVQNGRAYFDRDIRGLIDVVYVRMIPGDFGDVRDNEPYPIPSNYEGLLVQNTVQFFRGNFGLDDTSADNIDINIDPRLRR